MNTLLKYFLAVTLYFVTFYSSPTIAQTNVCKVNDICFKAGEMASYEIYYHWGLIWMNAGSVTFKVEEEIYKNKKQFHLLGEGSSHKSYDWFFKVRDKFESWADTATLKPTRFIRNTNEADNHIYNDNYFNYNMGKVFSFGYVGNSTKMKKDTTTIGNCTFDVMSMVYMARCIDFNNCKPDTKMYTSLFLDNKVYNNLYIKYVGKEKIKTVLGTIECIKFTTKLIEGTIFKGGEEMTVWVTNDKNKIPVYIETPIIVGEVQVKLKGLTGLKN